MVSTYRISIANLAPRIMIRDTGGHHFLGILNPTKHNKNGTKLLQPIGGAAELTDLGRHVLTEDFGAREFQGKDARFLIEKDRLESVFCFFERNQPRFVELDVIREMREELCTVELNGIPPILTPEEAGLITVNYIRSARQPPARTAETSPIAVTGIPTRRLFYLYELWMPQKIYEQIAVSPAIQELSLADLATTGGGSSGGITADGIALADNIGIY